jgi:phosphoribosyl 1,2-cyclic phosphodiesterase
MKLKFWGVRGSIPVCGKEYLKYGGSTTCLEIRDKNNDILIVDCGSGVRKLGKEVVKEGIRKIKIIFTHQHTDHVLGFPFFAPIYDKRNEIEVAGCAYNTNGLREIVAKTMRPPSFPVKFDEIDAKFNFVSMRRGGLKMNNIFVFPIELSHPNGGLGYRFEEDGKSIVFLTDNELAYIHPGGRSFNDYIEFAKNADILIADADYTDEEYKYRKGWGHSTYTQAFELAVKAKVGKLYFFHHNQDRTDKEIDKILLHFNKIAKKRNLNLKCFAAMEGETLNP